ncbi:uncharacterized protein JN550_013001 [Neoarthrinium moseri]|uniref:uncharacterized protein n=1 Tax=Neoarthrinium moseri TaxID=1658444 RepID=UPI001FDB50E5|nr:uncharacterized protein JN550_013001 [Neoarthrinium moseri]KAI1857861.1 hypothetical protein JN550_013001 [Neoarthrinium moseri]
MALPTNESAPIAVLGAGVVGLTTAMLLCRAGYTNIVVIAQHMPADHETEYTSNWAGADWVPFSLRGTREMEWDLVSWSEFLGLARATPAAGVQLQGCRAAAKAGAWGVSWGELRVDGNRGNFNVKSKSSLNLWVARRPTTLNPTIPQGRQCQSRHRRNRRNHTMLTSTTHFVRFGALGSRSLQLPSALARGAALPSLARRPLVAKASPRQLSTAALRPLPTEPACLQCQSAARRHASTAPSAAPSSTPTLDWNSFFTLRKTRRRFQLACSVATMVVGGSIAGLVLINVEMDWLGKIPLDPFITLGLMTMGSAALGWLAGPSLGATIFYMVKRGVKTPMAIKEAEFFARIKKNRVDPSVSSVGNPVPDYYGEKISSVAGYRQWLKDQRAFNKKRTSFI